MTDDERGRRIGPRDEEATVLPAGSGVEPVPAHGADAPAPEPSAPTPDAADYTPAADDADPADAADPATTASARPDAQSRARTPARPGAAKRAAITGIRLATGVVGVAVAVVALSAVSLVRLPSVSEPAPAATVTPVPAPLTRVCPGAVLALGGDGATDAATAASVGRASIVARAEGDELQRTTVTPSASEAQLLTASSGALLAGAQSQSVSTDDLRGLVTAFCSDPTGTAFLAAGATTTGRTSLISLTNPTRVDATVELRIWTEQGPVDAPGLRGIVVPAGAQKVLSLAGFAENAVSPVVEVTSRGGRVTAVLQESILRAVDPGGIDLAASSSAGTRLVIPGVTIAAKDAVDTLRGRSDYEDLQPVLRLLDPSGSDTTVRVGIRPERGGGGNAFDVPLTAGKVLDVPIDDLAEGSYSIELQSDAPIAAGIRASTAVPLSGSDALESPVSDLAWFAPAPLIGSRTLFAAPTVPSRLHVENPGDSAVSLTLRGQGTADLSLQVAAGASASVDLAASGVYRVDPSSPVRMAVVSQVSGGIGSYPVSPPPAASSPIVMRR